MDSPIDLSVITAVTVKDKPYLKNCLTSLETAARFAGRRLNFIIIGNGIKIEKINYLHFPVRLIINKTNLGFGPSVNKAINFANNSWCILVSPDVTTQKDCLKKLIPHKVDSRTALIGPRVSDQKGKLQYSILPYPSLIQLTLEHFYLYKLFPRLFTSPLSDSKLYETPRQVDAVAAIWWLFKRDAFHQTGGFDSRFFLYFEDVDFCKRLKEKGFEIIYNPAMRVTHLMHASTGGETDGKLYYNSLKKYLYKHHHRLSARISLLVFLTGSLFRLIFWQIFNSFNTSRENKIRATNKINYFRCVFRSVKAAL